MNFTAIDFETATSNRSSACAVGIITVENSKISDKWECTMKLCRANNKYPSGKLDECCAVDNIKLQHHEAISDARACAKLFLQNK